MEDKLLELIHIANAINQNNSNLYVQIEYTADETKKIKISIISKETCTFVETLRIDLTNNPYFKWETIFDTIKCYIGGVTNE